MSSVSAAVIPEAVQQALSQQDQQYVQQQGSAAVILNAAFWADYYSQLDDWRVRTGRDDGTRASMPDSSMTPLERAVRLFEAVEGKLPYVRYRITYRRASLSEYDYWQPRGHIEISRFNLGRIVRDELLAAHGATHTATPEAFGIDPHVRWRLVMAPTQGLNADVQAVTRQVLNATDALAADCFGVPCLSTTLVEGPVNGWQELDAPPQFALPLVGGFTDLAAAVGSVAAAGLGPSHDGYGESIEVEGRARPQLLLVASEGLGTDPMVDVLAHQPRVMDDAIAELWQRRVEVASSVFWNERIVYRLGRY